MSGIICWARLTFVISVLQFAPLQWQKGFNKIQEKNESQQNQNRSILVRGCHRSFRLQLHRARGRDVTENKIFGSPLLQKIDQGNLINSPSTGSSKSDYGRAWSSQEWKKMRLRHTIDQGNLIKLLGVWYNKFVLITEKTLLDGDA